MNITADQEFDASVEFADRYGNVVSPEAAGSLTFSVSDDSVISAVDNGDGTVTVSAVGPIGNATLDVQNDFNDDGTADFAGTLGVAVTAGDVAEIRLVASDARAKGDAPVEPPA